MITRSKVMVFFAAGLALAAATYAVASIPAKDGKIIACFKKSGGDLRVIDAAKQKCSKKERKLTWNRVGRRGPAGPTPTLKPEARHIVGSPVPGAPLPKCDTHIGTFCEGDYNGHWDHYANGYAPVAYFKDRAGFVHLEGLAKAFVDPSTNSPPTKTMFYLPKGYRPLNGTREFTVRACGGELNYVDIGTDGAVTASTDRRCVPLDGISFLR